MGYRCALRAVALAGLVGGFATAGGATNVIRVMTFNLRYASAPDGDNAWQNVNQAPARRLVARDVVLAHQPDLVALQEGETGQLDDFASLLPGYQFDRNRPSGGGGLENAAFAWNPATLDLLDRGVFALGPQSGGGYWNNPPGTNFNPYAYFPNMGLAFPRLALWGRFRWQATGQTFFFYTTHFDFNSDPQARSAALIADDARTRAERDPRSPLAIVCGDFNCTQDAAAWRLFTGSHTTNNVTGDFTDSWQQVHGSWNNSGTLHGYAGGVRAASERIDWILHRGGFTALTAQVVYDAALATNLNTSATRLQYPSDHYPVLATLRLPGPAADYDRDGLPDARESAHGNTLPADPDTDNDGLLDGQEDLNGNGQVEGGETDPAQATATQNPTDVRHYPMEGLADRLSTVVAENGLVLRTRFDGRYLYVATQDAGEGNDHFIFIATNPAAARAAPWAKSGQAAAWLAYLADENDNEFRGWFDAASAQITNLALARATTYFENGGWLEGVLDLGALLGPGFTTSVYLAVAPYGSGDGGALVTVAQAPAGNGDGQLLGSNEFVRLDPGDLDGDGVNDAADPDRDGDGLPDAWEDAFGLDSWSATGPDGAEGDVDGDRAGNRHEYEACTDPAEPLSVFQLSAPLLSALEWPVVQGKTTTLWHATGPGYSAEGSWTLLRTAANPQHFPVSNAWQQIGPSSGYYRILQSP